MTIQDFHKLLSGILKKQEQIHHILESGNSFLVSCQDDATFFINITESKKTFIHDGNNMRQEKEYFATHTKLKFTKELADMSVGHPGFFYYFIVFKKLEEVGIIDNALFCHIMDCIVYYNHEFDEFMVRILNHYNIGEN